MNSHEWSEQFYWILHETPTLFSVMLGEDGTWRHSSSKHTQAWVSRLFQWRALSSGSGKQAILVFDRTAWCKSCFRSRINPTTVCIASVLTTCSFNSRDNRVCCNWGALCIRIYTSTSSSACNIIIKFWSGLRCRLCLRSKWKRTQSWSCLIEINLQMKKRLSWLNCYFDQPCWFLFALKSFLLIGCY